VIAPPPIESSECLASCKKLTGLSAQQGLLYPKLFSCLGTCPGARVEKGACDSAVILPGERC